MPFKHESLVSRKDFYYLDPHQIVVRDGWNPRLEFDTVEDVELKLSIMENGVLEPLKVKRIGKQIVLLDGERRLRATLKAISEGYVPKNLGIPCLVQDHKMSDTEAMLLTLNVNTGKRLSPLEEAAAFNRLRIWNMPVATIAKRMGKSTPFVYRRLLLVDASPDLQKEIKDKKINLTDAEKIIKDSDGSIKKQAQKTRRKKRPNPIPVSVTCPHCKQDFIVQ